MTTAQGQPTQSERLSGLVHFVLGPWPPPWKASQKQGMQREGTTTMCVCIEKEH